MKPNSVILSQTLTQILSNFNSTYDAAQEVALQTGEPLLTIHKRLSNWLKKDPETWVKINQTLNCLGYRVRIEKVSSKEDEKKMQELMFKTFLPPKKEDKPKPDQ